MRVFNISYWIENTTKVTDLKVPIPTKNKLNGIILIPSSAGTDYIKLEIIINHLQTNSTRAPPVDLVALLFSLFIY